MLLIHSKAHTHTPHTHENKCCYAINMFSNSIEQTHCHQHVCSCMIAYNNTNVYRQVSLKINPHGYTHRNSHKEPQFLQRKQMGTINTLAPAHASTDTPIHAYMHSQLSHKKILLMQTQRPAVYTQRKQLQAINILAHIRWAHRKHTHMDAHVRRLILQLLGSRGTECPQQLWIPLNVRTGEGRWKG